MKNYLKSKLTQSSAWVGFFLIVGAFIFPRSFFIFGGILLILNDDEKLKSLFAKLTPKVNKFMDGGL